MQDTTLTPDKVLNSLIYGPPFYVIVYTSYKLSKWSGILWLELTGVFGVLSNLLNSVE